jgi:penicillin-binding protein 1A
VPTAIIKVEGPDGTRVFNEPQTQPLTKQEADEVTYCLEQVVHGGTGSGAFFGKNIAGKTGTTDKNKDAWFVGFTPNGYTTAVWMGFRNAPEDGPPKFMNNVHGRVVFGGTFPATIWHKYMQVLTDGMDVGDFVGVSQFPGKVLNPDLTTTSSTDTTLPDSTTSTSAPGSTTATTLPDTTTSTETTVVPN